MILPTKGIEPSKALLTIGADVLRELDEAKTVSRLWSDLRGSVDRPLNITFDWFVLSLNLLYTIGAIEQSGGRLRRQKTESGGQG